MEELERQPYWRKIQAETETRLIDVIREAIDDKLSPYKLGMMIRQHLGGMAANKRAQKIARTETTAAMNAGHVAAMDELMAEGIITGKEWSAIGDQDTRPIISPWLALSSLPVLISASADFRRPIQGIGGCRPSSACDVDVRC